MCENRVAPRLSTLVESLGVHHFFEGIPGITRKPENHNSPTQKSGKIMAF
jgi:hypothetical protein